MRLAERLFEWTGDAEFADYIERNRYNGIYAQQHPETGMVAYYLPLHAGGHKVWATPTESFWCCMGTLVQAHARNGTGVYFTDGRDLTIAQYVASTARWTSGAGGGTGVQITTHTYEDPPEPGRANFEHSLPAHRPDHVALDIDVAADAPAEFALHLRLPWWLAGQARITIDGEPVPVTGAPGSFHELRRTWDGNRVHIELPRSLMAVPLPDRPDTVAFMDGPVVLAGLVGEGRTLRGDVKDPLTMLEQTGELELGVWRSRYSTRRQAADFNLVPLHEITDEAYTVYFPVQH
jgi:DUF1680 family protein